MRIIKSNKGYYKSFAETLVESPANVEMGQTTDYYIRKMRDRDRRLSKFMESLVDFDLQLHHADQLSELVGLVKKKAQSLFEINELAFFYLDEGYDDFSPVTNGYSKAFGEIIQAIKKDSIFDSLIKSNKMIIIPISDSIKMREKINNILFIPIKKWKINKYFVCIDTPIKKIDEESFEAKALMTILAHAVPNIENVYSRRQLLKVYKDFQLYQSKFLKDYRLAVIGELTLGMVEEIISPMQVIVSSLGILSDESDKIDTELYNAINRQINKIKGVIKRLVKFSQNNVSGIEIQPVNLNDIIRDYVAVTNANFKSSNFECITDLEKNLPAVLSNRSYINLILSNMFSLIRKDEGKGGAIIQTRVNENYVFIKALTTNYIEDIVNNDGMETVSLEYLILENLVKKHEGKMITKTNPKEGSKIVVALPIIRKMRK